MEFVCTEEKDLARLCSFYRHVIDTTPDMDQYIHWEWGKHPSDEALRQYITSHGMFHALDHDAIVGAVAMTCGQNAAYRNRSWPTSAPDETVRVLHLLAVDPDCLRRGIGRYLLEGCARTADADQARVLRLDTFTANLPAQKLYVSAGYTDCGTGSMMTDNCGLKDFVFYERRL